ncbi:MAG: hypothetical protein GF308_09355 [Candidatus Heimdallarchaeota archaeon]|nr:hypothetical protein [Candidatus Heimdallarchaeota archaeon]
MIDLYSIILFSLETISFLGSAIILFRTYRRTKYPSHVILATSFCSIFLSAIMRFSTSFFDTNLFLFGSSVGIVDVFWSIMNTALIIGIYLTFFAFIFVKLNRFHPILNFVSLLTGALIFAFIYPPFTTITFNETTNAWVATYNTWVLVLIIPLLLFFITAVILPVATKIKESSDRELKAQMIFQVIGLGMVIIWAFLAAFTGVKIIAIIRPFVLPLGWFIWSLTVLVDPFNIMVSNAEISQIYIATEEGLPIYFKDLEGTQNMSANLAATLISGVTTALEDLVQRKDKLSVLNYENQVLGIVSVDFLTAYVFGERFDRTLETVLKFSLESLLNDPELMLTISPGCVELSGERQAKVTGIVDEALQSVLIL